MQLEHQFCSPELSKRLKELGVSQSSLFWWAENHDEEIVLLVYETDVGFILPSGGGFDPRLLNNCRMFSAFTVAELGSILWHKASPENILKAYGVVFNVSGTTVITAEGLSQCMENPELGAKMLIYLLENKLINL